MSIKFSWFTMFIFGLLSIVVILFSVHSVQKNTRTDIFDKSILNTSDSLSPINKNNHMVLYHQETVYHFLALNNQVLPKDILNK